MSSMGRQCAFHRFEHDTLTTLCRFRASLSSWSSVVSAHCPPTCARTMPADESTTQLTPPKPYTCPATAHAFEMKPPLLCRKRDCKRRLCARVHIHSI